MATAVTELMGALPAGLSHGDRVPKTKVLLLSASVLTDRMFLHTKFFDALGRDITARVWARSAADQNDRSVWQTSGIEVKEYPFIYPFKEFPYNFLRRLNEYNSDFRRRSPSRLSMMRLMRNKRMGFLARVAKCLARLTSLFPWERTFEDRLERFLLTYERSPEATEWLLNFAPDVVLCSGPFQYSEPAITAAAKRLKIPVLALIPSWDNLSTKNRLGMKYDGYVVWSDTQRHELHELYPESRDVPCYVVGAPQFDAFFDRRFYLTREQFCEARGLDPKLPIIVYAIGSPNFLKGETHGALFLCESVLKGDLGEVQVIVRPHPLHDKGELKNVFGKLGRRVVVQQYPARGTGRSLPDADQVVEWVNTFKHADVVVNLSSTVTVDACIFDRPVVNLDYDPAPGRPQQELIKDINHVWQHFKPIAESGGVWLVNDSQQMIEAIRGYLADPSLHRDRRRWLAQYVCQYLDGRCGERMATAILDFLQEQTPRLESRQQTTTV